MVKAGEGGNGRRSGEESTVVTEMDKITFFFLDRLLIWYDGFKWLKRS
jgi:hypothetical protein